MRRFDIKLICLGSGSSGNCYLLESDTECLVIEAGISFMEVKKALDFNIRKIVGVVATHCHQDHCKFVPEYEKSGIKVFKPYICEDSAKTICNFGNFTIKAFPLVHDVPCYGFWIHHSEMGKMVYITDTEYCKPVFRGLNHILIEANYADETINKYIPNYEHVLQGHMNLKNTLEFIKKNDNPALRDVMLCHLSEQNAHAEFFGDKAEEITDKVVNVAKKGLWVDYSLVPF